MATNTASTKDKIIYWTSTGIIAAIMLWSAYNFNFNDTYRAAFHHLGLPDWFKMELTFAKILGTLALLLPFTPYRLRMFAYCGFAIVLLSTPIAHLSSGDSPLMEVGHAFFFVTLTVSYIYYHRIVGINAWSGPTAIV
ncbi:MAG: DoxX family protein [Bacteroidetes bacterium]|nr:DoxX family protein [Bacteroidota bacterium]